jgi:flagellum-specific peptidoglycan hydrolase FlgJ
MSDLTPAQRSLWLASMLPHAKASGHKWPAAAVAEAAVETGWGEHYVHQSNNVLGIKAFGSWKGPKFAAPGTEQNKDGSYTVPASMMWRGYPSFDACFADQMVILHEPRYAAALAASTIQAYILEECAIWSTGQEKGKDVLLTFRSHLDVLG